MKEDKVSLRDVVARKKFTQHGMDKVFKTSSERTSDMMSRMEKKSRPVANG